MNTAAVAPFHRAKSSEIGESHTRLMKEKWDQLGKKFEAILSVNGGNFMVGTRLSYADVLVTHVMTWFIEEVRFLTIILSAYQF